MSKTTAGPRIAKARRSRPSDAAFDCGSAPAVENAIGPRALRSLIASSASSKSCLATSAARRSAVAARGSSVRASVGPLRLGGVGPTPPLAPGERAIRCASRERVSGWRRARSARSRLPSAFLTSISGCPPVRDVPATGAFPIGKRSGSGAGDEIGAGVGGAGSGTEADGVSAVGGVGATEAGGAGAGGAAGAGGGMGAARDGSKDSGSTYVSSSPTRIPRWTYGTSCSRTPVGPASASAAPSATRSPRFTRSGPRWVNETL